MTEIPNYTFFWTGPFSQWYPSKFSIDGVKYGSAEQYMMAQKAIMFDDQDAFKKILLSHSPRQQKHLGRSVKGFKKVDWEKVARGFVYMANYAKFTQNPELRELLLKTRGTELVEASPYDKIWGIGLPEGHKDIYDKRKWQGKNWLGQVLTQVRLKIEEESK